MTKLIMADAEYRAIDRPSFSSLKHLLKSVRKYLHEKKVPFKGNDATRLGTAVHNTLQGQGNLIVYEPDLSQIKTKAGVLATNPRMTDEGKKLIAECESKLTKEQVLVPHDTKIIIQNIVENFWSNPALVKLMSGVTDFEAVHLGEVEGVPIKAKFDFEGFQDGRYFMGDFKTVGKDAQVPNINYTLRDSNYDMQLALYSKIFVDELKINLEDIDVYLIALETHPPYDVYPYKMSLVTHLKVGEYKYIDALFKYKKMLNGEVTTNHEIQEI